MERRRKQKKIIYNNGSAGRLKIEVNLGGIMFTQRFIRGQLYYRWLHGFE